MRLDPSQRNRKPLRRDRPPGRRRGRSEGQRAKARRPRPHDDGALLLKVDNPTPLAMATGLFAISPVTYRASRSTPGWTRASSLLGSSHGTLTACAHRGLHPPAHYYRHGRICSCSSGDSRDPSPSVPRLSRRDAQQRRVRGPVELSRSSRARRPPQSRSVRSLQTTGRRHHPGRRPRQSRRRGLAATSVTGPACRTRSVRELLWTSRTCCSRTVHVSPSGSMRSVT
jgi:hypothetical protein